MKLLRPTDMTLKEVFKELYTITETHESTEGETIEVTVDVSTLGYNNSGDVTLYEDDYIELKFEKGDASTKPKYYTEGGYRFYDKNRIFISTKANTTLEEIRFYASSNKYQPEFEYISGTETTAKDVNLNTAVTTLYFNGEVNNSYQLIFNTTGDYTQSRVPSFSYKVTIGETKEEVTNVYDEDINALYPASRIIEDDFGETIFNVSDTYIDRLFQLLYAKFEDWCVFTCYKEDIEKKWKEWYTRFLARFFMTKDRYETLIDLYNKENDNLLAQLKSSRSIVSSREDNSKYNDTPQIVNDGTIEGDEYVSTFSKDNSDANSEEVTAYDPATTMNRIDEIQRLLRDIWNNWCDEFKRLFYPLQEDKYYD